MTPYHQSAFLLSLWFAAALAACQLSVPSEPKTPDATTIDSLWRSHRTDSADHPTISLEQLRLAAIQRDPSLSPAGGSPGAAPRYSTSSFLFEGLGCDLTHEQYGYDSIAGRGWDAMSTSPNGIGTIMYMNRNLSGVVFRDESHGDTIALQYTVPWDEFGNVQHISVTAVIDSAHGRMSTIDMQFSKRFMGRNADGVYQQTMDLAFHLTDVAMSRTADGRITCTIMPAQFFAPTSIFSYHFGELETSVQFRWCEVNNSSFAGARTAVYRGSVTIDFIP